MDISRDMNDLPSTLRAERARRNLSRQDLAKQAGVSPSAIDGIESGRVTNPKLQTLQRIAAAMQLPVQSLLPQPIAA